MANKLLNENLSEPLNGATSARVDINCGVGNLTVDRFTGGEPVLANGTLQYFEKQGPPTQSLDTSHGQTALTLKADKGSTGRSGFRFPWDACRPGAFDWDIHINPAVQSDITAHSDGGNVRLDLSGMAIKRLSADTGGGNMAVVLPDSAANLDVVAKTGGGNVTVEIGNGITGNNTVDAGSGAGNVEVLAPAGIAARIHASSGLGKVIVDPQFARIDSHTYQSPEYDSAANKVEITVKSGAGNVTVNTR